MKFRTNFEKTGIFVNKQFYEAQYKVKTEEITDS